MFWLKDGRVVTNDAGQPLNCDDCPCENPCACTACSENPPNQVDLTVPALAFLGFGCTECPDLAGVYRVTLVPCEAGTANCTWRLDLPGDGHCGITVVELIASPTDAQCQLRNASGQIITAFGSDPTPANCAFDNYAMSIFSGSCGRPAVDPWVRATAV